MAPRLPYGGSHRKLVLAFDVGTTYSGISYSLLDPGEPSEIYGVTRFPSQEQVGGDSKIPTVVYYDQDGIVQAVGAETENKGLEEKIEENGWTKAEWFKLHMAPKSETNSNAYELPALPRNKSVVDVMADFLQYLYECAKSYIVDTHANGVELWTSVGQHIEFVLTHPNGWGGAQQAQMRKAAVQGGLVSDTGEGRARVHFVTEGEASLHFCIQNGLATDAIRRGEGILIVDAGGGTIDLSAYGPSESSASSFQEIAPSQCHFHGSIFVTQHARAFLRDLFDGSKFIEDLDHITSCFDRTTKLRFRNPNEPQFIKFGTSRDKDPDLHIRSGQLKLDGTHVANFFKPSVDCITAAILDQQATTVPTISSIFLVGGFAASDWLFYQIKNSLQYSGVNFCRPDSHVNKAVADGAVSFFIDHFVKARVSKYAYGVECRVLYHNAISDHVQRKHTVIVNEASGETLVPSYFSIILPKNTQVLETMEFRHQYFRHEAEFDDDIEDQIIRYHGSSENPQWTDVDAEMYSKLCTIITPTALFRNILQPRQNDGKIYYRLDYEVILSFGLTELKAQISWKENGQEIRSPANIVYDHDVRN